MTNIFRAIDNFLTDCEEYVDTRVWNGKFINDIKYLTETNVENAKDSYHKKSQKVQSSNTYIALVLSIKKFWQQCMRVSFFAEIVGLLIDSFKLYTKHFAHYLTLLIFSLFSASWLLSAFQTSPLFFSVLLIPILLANHLTQSGFYLFVEEKEGERMTPGTTLTILKQTFSSNSFLFLLQISASATIVILHFGISFIISSIFGVFAIDWSSSSVYWTLFILLGVFFLCILYLIQSTMALAYSFIVVDKNSATDALYRSWHHIRTDFRHSGLYYVLLGIVSFLFIWQVTGNYYEGGFTVSMLFAGHAFLLLSFLLRKRYFLKDITHPGNVTATIQTGLKPLLILGILSYIAFAVLLMQIHADIMRLFLEQRPKIVSNFQYKTFNNFQAGYSIDYPLSWFVSNQNPSSISIYSNDRATTIGGVMITVDVYPAANSNYFSLYGAKPGTITTEAKTKNVRMKSSNFIKQGKNGVKYTYTKNDGPQQEFETHYMILDDDVIYEIAFVTASKKIENDYEAVFTTIFDSFRLLTN